MIRLATILSSFPLLVSASPNLPRLAYPAAVRTDLGGVYVARLEPDVDTLGNVVLIDLVIERKDRRANRNLIEPAGIWHGLEPFAFAAADFRNDARPVFPRTTRTFSIDGAKKRLRVRVLSANLGQTGAWNGGSLALDLQIIDQPG